MRKFFWAGVVGTLLYLPFRIEETGLLYSGFSDSYIMPRSAMPLIRFLETILYPLYIDGSEYVLYMLCVITAIAVAFKTDVIGKVRPLGSGKLLGILFDRPGGLGGLALGVTVSVIAVYAAIAICPFWHTFFTDYSLWERALYYMGGPGMALIHYYVLSFSKLPFVFAASVLAYAAITYKDFDTLRQGLKVALFAFSVGAAWYVAVNEHAYSKDMHKDLRSITEMDCHVQRRDWHILSDDPLLLPINPRFNFIGITKTGEGPIYYNHDNFITLKKYLEENGRTLLNGPIRYYLISYHISRLEIDDAHDEAIDLFMDSRDPGAIMLSMSYLRLKYGNASRKRLAQIDRLTDEELVYVPESYYYKVAGMYLNQGEMTKAAYWHEKAVQAAASETEDLYAFDLPDEPPFHDGRIDGKILIDGGNAKDVAVGIIRSKNLDGFGQFQLNHLEDDGFINPIMDMYHVKDGVPVDEDGTFTFTGIHEEDYILVLSVPVSGGYTHTVINPPGVISISEANPTVDVGTIKLQTVDRFPEAALCGKRGD